MIPSDALQDKKEAGTEELDAAALASASAKVHKKQMEKLAQFSFHQLVSLIELREADRVKVGSLDDPADEYLRFRATRSLGFGPGDISSLSDDKDDDLLEVRVNFFGLYGPASPLPPSFTERIIEDEKTPAPVEDLMDLFNHRLISLLHVIWRKYRYYLRYEEGGMDPLSKRFLALCGFPIEDRSHIGQISRSALLPHVGLLALYSSSAGVVSSTISNFFKVPCHIREYVPRTVQIDSESRSLLGRRNHRLGEDIILGDQVDDNLGKFRVCLGRADFGVIAPFLPDGARHGQLSEILSMTNREPLDWDIEFDFKPDTIPMGQLGEARLGWTSWLQADDPGDLESTVCIAPVERPLTAQHEGGFGQ